MYVSQKGWFNVLKIDYPPVGRSKSQVPRSPANHRALALGSQVAEGGLVCFSGVGRGQTPIIRKIWWKTNGNNNIFEGEHQLVSCGLSLEFIKPPSQAQVPSSIIYRITV